MGGVSWYKLVVYILISAKRKAYFCKNIAIEVGGISRCFSKVSGSRVDSPVLNHVQRGTPVQHKAGTPPPLPHPLYRATLWFLLWLLDVAPDPVHQTGVDLAASAPREGVNTTLAGALVEFGTLSNCCHELAVRHSAISNATLWGLSLLPPPRFTIQLLMVVASTSTSPCSLARPRQAS